MWFDGGVVEGTAILSRRGFLRLAGITTAVIAVPSLWVPRYQMFTLVRKCGGPAPFTESLEGYVESGAINLGDLQAMFNGMLSYSHEPNFIEEAHASTIRAFRQLPPDTRTYKDYIKNYVPHPEWDDKGVEF